MNMKYFLAAIAAALLLVVAGAANAGERIEGSGHEGWYTTLVSELEFGEGHSAMLWRGEGVQFGDDPSQPAGLMTGDCVAIFEFMPDETYKGNGFCTYTDLDGDKTFFTFWEGSDMEEGRTKYFGGTGKFAGVTGGGTYTGEELTDTLSMYTYKDVMELP